MDFKDNSLGFIFFVLGNFISVVSTNQELAFASDFFTVQM